MSFFKNKDNDVRVVWKIGIVLLVFFVATIILSIIISFCYTIAATLSSGITDPVALTEKLMNDKYLTAISGIAQNVVMILTVILFWKVFDKKPLRDMGLSSIRHGMKDMVYGLIFGAISISAIFFVLLLTGQIYVTNEFLKPNISWFLLTDLILMVFVGFGEEIFSRGYCMTILKKSGIALVYIIPNVIFALLHISNNDVSILPLIGSEYSLV